VSTTPEPVDDSGTNDLEPLDCAPPDGSEDGSESWRAGLEQRPNAPTLAFPARLELAARGWTTVEAFPGLSFHNPTTFTEPVGTDKIFVSELGGRIYAFANDPNVTDRALVLDISDRTEGGDLAGLVSIAFHPDFGKRE